MTEERLKEVAALITGKKIKLTPEEHVTLQEGH